MKNYLYPSLKLFILILPLFYFSQNNPVINATLVGRVVDSSNNEIISDAKITIKGTTNGDETDSNGEFHLKTGQKFPFTIIIYKAGFQKQEFVATQNRIEIKLNPSENQINEVVVTARRKQESAQSIPIPISVVSGSKIESTGSFNVNFLKELVPSVQLYSSNARNTTLYIRGLGSPFGLTNDGIDPGVGFYIDGVYYARPATTALDFIDIDKIEVLRGPQGTLFGKNTSSGAFNITTKAASFTSGATLELTSGNYGFLQAKGSITGPISNKLAARFSFSGTHRDGLLYNLHTQSKINDLSNMGFKGQLLYKLLDGVKVTLIGDYTSQDPDGYGWPIAGVVTTQRAAYRQFNAIIADLGYKIPYNNAFDRIVDLDSPSKAKNILGGFSANADIKLGNGVLTSTTAWRYWNWDPSNDRDYTGLPVFTKSAGNSVHQQYSQELRYSGKINNQIFGVIGAYGLWQDLRSDPVQTEEAGSAQYRFAQNSTSDLWKTPGLFDGFGIKTTNKLLSTTLAIFGQADWKIGEKFHVLPGLRYNNDEKIANYNRLTYGGLQTNDPALIALKNSVYTNQAFNTQFSENNLSGNITLQYKYSNKINAFATFSTSYKPSGINLGGLPTDSKGVTLVDLAKVLPEFTKHYEVGFKTRPSLNSVLNVVLFNDDVKNYQTQVQTPEPGVNRGYLANAEKVRVRGVEVDGNYRIIKAVSINVSGAYNDAKYVSFKNAPVPLEDVGGALAFKDISGGRLPGVSKWTATIGGEAISKGNFLGLVGEYIFGVDEYCRTDFSSSPSPSRYLNIPAYGLLNVRLGFKAENGTSINLWAKNVLNKNYYEQFLIAPGSAGHYAGVLGDPRTFGVTFKYNY